MPTLRFIGLFVAGLLVSLFADSGAAEIDAVRTFDMRPHWESTTALANPHKGWYHHFPDNHPDKYLVRSDSDLLDFPGMDHVYIRLAWSYLEPREGEFHWDVIDRWIEKWVAHGLGISFRISCKETSTDRVEQQFATPKWVMEAGAEGGYYRKGQRTGPDGPWEPKFDEPVFLQKLKNFLKAFAARYDGKPWLRYVDISSIGDWGEGHTSSGSRLQYGFEPRGVTSICTASISGRPSSSSRTTSSIRSPTGTSCCHSSGICAVTVSIPSASFASSDWRESKCLKMRTLAPR